MTNLQLAKQFIREIIISGESADAVEMFAEWLDNRAHEPTGNEVDRLRKELRAIMLAPEDETSTRLRQMACEALGRQPVKSTADDRDPTPEHLLKQGYRSGQVGDK